MKTVAFYRSLNENDMAKKYVEKLLEVGGGDPRTDVFASEFYSASGDLNKASELLGEVVRTHPDNAEYRVIYSAY